MGTIRVHEFVTVDGVFENPAWTAPYGFPDALGEALAAVTSASDAILLGRRTWEMFWPAWSTRTVHEDPGAPLFNDTPQYVFSSTRTSADEWQNSSLLGPSDAAGLRKRKDETSGTYIRGSGTLVRGLRADGLVDELHLIVYPVVLGSGAKLFPEGAPNTPMALAHQEVYDNGVLHLTYTPAG